jgi:hypothetical protein
MAASSNSHDWAGPRALCTLYRCSAGCLLAPGPNPLAYICYRPNTWMAVTPHIVLCMPCSNQAQGGDRSVARRRIPADRGAGLLFLLACSALSNKAGFWYYCTPPAAPLSGWRPRRDPSPFAPSSRLCWCCFAWQDSGQWLPSAHRLPSPAPAPYCYSEAATCFSNPYTTWGRGTSTIPSACSFVHKSKRAGGDLNRRADDRRAACCLPRRRYAAAYLVLYVTTACLVAIRPSPRTEEEPEKKHNAQLLLLINHEPTTNLFIHNMVFHRDQWSVTKYTSSPQIYRCTSRIPISWIDFKFD